jgi:hypothetical protein
MLYRGTMSGGGSPPNCSIKAAEPVLKVKRPHIGRRLFKRRSGLSVGSPSQGITKTKQLLSANKSGCQIAFGQNVATLGFFA